MKVQIEYSELEKRSNRFMITTYHFEGAKFDYLMDALTYVGNECWELIGQIDGKLILKRRKY